MNYKKLWNDLKDEMITRMESEHVPGVDLHVYMLYASDVLYRMAKAEVAECKESERKEVAIDLELAEAFFRNGGMK